MHASVFPSPDAALPPTVVLKDTEISLNCFCFTLDCGCFGSSVLSTNPLKEKAKLFHFHWLLSSLFSPLVVFCWRMGRKKRKMNKKPQSSNLKESVAMKWNENEEDCLWYHSRLFFFCNPTISLFNSLRALGECTRHMLSPTQLELKHPNEFLLHCTSCWASSWGWAKEETKCL